MSIFGNKPGSFRRRVFYSVCIPVRVAVLLIIFFVIRSFRDGGYVAGGLLFAGSFGMLANKFRLSDSVWWSRPIHSICFYLFCGAFILGMTAAGVDRSSVSLFFGVVFGGDISFGLLTALKRRPFD